MFRLPNALESVSNHNGGQLTKVTELLHSDASLLVVPCPHIYRLFLPFFSHACYRAVTVNIYFLSAILRLM